MDKNLKMKRRAITRVRDLYSQAKMLGMPAKEIDMDFLAIMGELSKCPLYIRSFIEGYEQALRDALYTNDLVFGCWIDGVFYSNNSSRDDYYEKLGKNAIDYSVESNNGSLGYYWSHDTKRPYFI